MNDRVSMKIVKSFAYALKDIEDKGLIFKIRWC